MTLIGPMPRTEGRPRSHAPYGRTFSPRELQNVILSKGPDGSTELYLPNSLTQLDLGGIAKGVALDRIGDALIAAGMQDWIMEWGGEIKSSGQHPDGRDWRICVLNPPRMSRLVRSFADLA